MLAVESEGEDRTGKAILLGFEDSYHQGCEGLQYQNITNTKG